MRVTRVRESSRVLTLGNFLAAEDLGKLLLDQLVALLADGNYLLASDAELGDLGENLLRDLRGGLVLGKGVGVVEGVVCELVSVTSSPSSPFADTGGSSQGGRGRGRGV